MVGVTFYNFAYISAIFGTILTIMASQPAEKNVLSSDLENVGQGHHLHKSLYLSYYTTDFYHTFIQIISLWPATKMSYKLTLKM